MSGASARRATSLRVTNGHGWNIGTHAGAQFALTPGFAFYYELGAAYYRFKGDTTRQQLRLGVDVGITLLP